MSAEKIDAIERITKNPAVILCIVAMIFGYGVRQIYADLKARNEVLVEIIREQISESRAVSDALRSLSSRIESGNFTKNPVEHR